MRWMPVFVLAALLASAIVSAAAAAEAADPRLEQKVTLRLKKRPLADVLTALRRATGVTFRAAPEVADEPAVVYVFDQPAGAVMRQLARLFGYRWVRTGGREKPSYELMQPRAAKEEEEALRRRDRQRPARKMASLAVDAPSAFPGLPQVSSAPCLLVSRCSAACEGSQPSPANGSGEG